MGKKRVNIDELKGHNGYDGYQVMPPCCADELTHTINLGSIVRDGECWNCGTEIDIELVLES